MELTNKQIKENNLITHPGELIIYNWLKRFKNVLFIYDEPYAENSTQYINTWEVSVCDVEVVSGFDYSKYINEDTINKIKIYLKKQINECKKYDDFFIVRLNNNGGGLFEKTNADYDDVIKYNLDKNPFFNIIMRFSRMSKEKFIKHLIK